MNPLRATSAEMQYDHRCWRVHWSHVQRAYETLKEDYGSTGIDHNKMRYDADVFFILANHLPEWVAGDKDPVCQLTRSAALGAREQDDLVLVRDFANTSKHHTRSGRGDTVYVDKVLVSDQGSSAEITCEHEDGTREPPRDALDLASSVMAIWQRCVIEKAYIP